MHMHLTSSNRSKDVQSHSYFFHGDDSFWKIGNEENLYKQSWLISTEDKLIQKKTNKCSRIYFNSFHCSVFVVVVLLKRLKIVDILWSKWSSWHFDSPEQRINKQTNKYYKPCWSYRMKSKSQLDTATVEKKFSHLSNCWIASFFLRTEQYMARRTKGNQIKWWHEEEVEWRKLTNVWYALSVMQL